MKYLIGLLILQVDMFAVALPEGFSKFKGHVEVTELNQFIRVKSDGVPDHTSPYFPRFGDRYESYNGTNQNFRKNPNMIREQDFSFYLPKNPQPAQFPERTPLGPIGVAINGVPLFNQFAGPNDRPLTHEIDSFDQYNGHPQRTGVYHYHVEPLAIVNGNSDVLVGYLLDGYPVYGPIEHGVRLSSDDLNDFHGHIHKTKEYPEGIFHYHLTDDAPYINGGSFYGELGYVE